MLDTVFYNGRIETLDNENSTAQAVGVFKGHVAAVGADKDLLKLCGPKTEKIDLKGAVMFPGFMEGHNHLPMFGYLMDDLDLSPASVSRMDDILTLVKGEAEKRPAGAWIKGSRYAEYFLAENRHPTRHDLDAVAPNHPVALFHTSFHACVLNGKGLEQAGYTRDTPNPQGGLIEKDPATGEPTGVLHDTAMMEVFNKLFFGDLAALTTEQGIAFCDRTTKYYARFGLVQAQDALALPISLTIYQNALAANRLNVRIYTMNYAVLADPLTGSCVKTGFGSDMLRMGPIKIFADGGMSNRTAAVREPFVVPAGQTGLKMYGREELIEMVKWYDALGWQVAIHAQGDAGISDTLDAYQAVLGPKSNNPKRHRIEHAGGLFPDLLKRAKDMNIMASVQPIFISELGGGFLEAFGPERAHQLYPFKTMLASGMKLGGSSDCPVSTLDPRLGLRDAVLRRTPSGEILGPDERLTMDQALRLWTQGSAWLSFDESHNGIIAPGMRADFTVMAEDPRQVEPEAVPDIPFTMTIVDGRVVWAE